MPDQRTAHLKTSPRMFDNDLLDAVSRVHPAVPAIIYVPVIAAMVLLAANGGYAGGTIALLVAVGVGIWTLTEYWLHRKFFHWEPTWSWGGRFHFVIHGVHHEHPNDRMRLVMPPSASIPLAAMFLGLYVLIFGTPAAYPLFAGLLLGYLEYDYTHYHLHHHAPKTAVGRRLREQHMRHHFQDHSRGFGVSSPLWDHIFRTISRNRRAT